MTEQNGFADLHTHTLFCDGHHTPREYVEEAIRRGMRAIGFSMHSYTSFDESYCIPKERIEDYKAEIRALSLRYGNRISIFCGTELDAYSDMPYSDLDYTIGSCHYVKKDGSYYPVDHKRELSLSVIDEVFSGDAYAFCEAYFEGVASLYEKKPDIIGHFDLVTKFNEGETMFSESHPRYIAAWQAALDRLLLLGVPFEVNTGAISRGYRSAPYPASPILAYIKEKGGSVILSSDSHKKDTLTAGFSDHLPKLEALGFTPTEHIDRLLRKIEARTH